MPQLDIYTFVTQINTIACFFFCLLIIMRFFLQKTFFRSEYSGRQLTFFSVEFASLKTNISLLHRQPLLVAPFVAHVSRCIVRRK